MDNQKSSVFSTRLPPKLSQALQEIIKRRHAAAPLFEPPTTSDVLRWLVAEEYERINKPAANCVREQRVVYSHENT